MSVCSAYGAVYKAMHKESSQLLAIKQVPVDADLQDIIKEISIMQQCDRQVDQYVYSLVCQFSQFVVKYYGSYFKNTDLWVMKIGMIHIFMCFPLSPFRFLSPSSSPSLPPTPSLKQIVMEYCGGGSVSDIMRIIERPVCHMICHMTLHNFQLKEEEIAIILQYALKGLEYLHFKRKIHRDIKAGNILLNLDGHAKLGETHFIESCILHSCTWIIPRAHEKLLLCLFSIQHV